MVNQAFAATCDVDNEPVAATLAEEAPSETIDEECVAAQSVSEITSLQKIHVLFKHPYTTFLVQARLLVLCGFSREAGTLSAVC